MGRKTKDGNLMRDYDPNFKYTADYLRGMETLALHKFVVDAKRTRHELRQQNAPFKKAHGSAPPDIWKKIRRDIARALTIINERWLNEDRTNQHRTEGL